MKEQTTWKAGTISAQLESVSGDPGTVSLGHGDNGGASYGTYQLASKPGTVQRYLKKSRFGGKFEGLEPGSAEFNAKWKQVAREYPDFGADQHDFIRRTHVEPVNLALSKRGLDMTDRGPAVQEMVWSTAVQYGGNAPHHIDRGLRESFGEGYTLSDLSDLDIVRSVQDSKLLHVNADFRNTKPHTRQGVETRIPAEKAALSHLAETGNLPTPSEISRFRIAAAPIRRGSSSARVTELQDKLLLAGVLTDGGERIVADGDFGPSTQQAVRAFQRSVGIPESDEAGALTIHMLDRTNRLRTHVAEVAALPQREALACRLDDHNHPDHLFFKQARERVAELDRSLGRTPDQYTDSITSALTVQARSDGLHRIDEVSLTEDGRELWGIQWAPDRTDHLFSLQTKVPTVEALSPMEDIAARWSEAMRQFEAHEQGRADGRQQSIDRAQPEFAHENIRELQQNLNTLGIRDMSGERLALTGTNDMATQTAVARFQSGRGFPVTGMADDTTRTAIQGEAFIAELQQHGHVSGLRNVAEIERTAPLAPTRNDPRNPESPNHTLYNELERCLPESSDERLLQFTAACHRHRITARDLSGVHVDYNGQTVSFDSHGLMATPAVVDLSMPPPEAQQSIEQIQQVDQARDQIIQQSRERAAQMSQQGPVM